MIFIVDDCQTERTRDELIVAIASNVFTAEFMGDIAHFPRGEVIAQSAARCIIRVVDEIMSARVIPPIEVNINVQTN